jgi:transcriptional regulator with XRE-family HTH domain
MNTQVRTEAVVPESTAAIGAEIRALRRARGMTISDLAEASGVSLSHVSAIERGAVNPSLAKIEKLADALVVPAAWFFTNRAGAGPLERDYVVRAENRRNLNMVYGEAPEVSGYSDWLLSSSIGGDFYMGLSDFHPANGAAHDALFTREGEQHVLVIDGELVLRLQDEEIVLRPGDSYSIPGGLPHHVFNRTDAVTRVVWVNAPVILPAQGTAGDSKLRIGNVTRVGAQAPDT